MTMDSSGKFRRLMHLLLVGLSARIRAAYGLPAVLAVLLTVLLGSQSGCSLGVMAGKMLTGDPTVQSEFKSMTGVDLSKGEHKVIVICSTPQSVDAELSTLKLDLLDGITRRMKRHKIQVVSPDDVARWIDDHGGIPDDPADLAKDFDCNYIASVEINEFTFREANSPKLLRGRTAGFIRVFEVEKVEGEPITGMVFNREFTVVYPPHQPISEQGRSSIVFQKEYIDRVCSQIAEKFYPHLPGTGI